MSISRISYKKGFEDGVELALKKMEESKSLEEAKKKVLLILSRVKEDKFEELEEQLGV
ncbi:MAG: hypothetical protein ACP6IS_11195 [Candidatus Asgardarchaeia archaeon]